jgi:hypothetical protein
LPPPPPNVPTGVLKAYGGGQYNLSYKLHTTGATASDLAEARTGFTGLYNTMSSAGTLSTITTVVQSNPAAVNAFNPATVNAPALTTTLNQWMPITEADVQAALNNIGAQAKAGVLTTSVATAFENWLNALEQAESSVGSGVILVNKHGVVRSSKPVFKEADLCTAGVLAALVGLIAIFTPEIEVGMLFGVMLDAGDMFAMMGILYGIIASIQC